MKEEKLFVNVFKTFGITNYGTHKFIMIKSIKNISEFIDCNLSFNRSKD